MAWLKTIDGDLVNLDSGVKVCINDGYPDAYVSVIASNGGYIAEACNGTKEENRQYMKDFEEGLLNADEIIIDPS